MVGALADVMVLEMAVEMDSWWAPHLVERMGLVWDELSAASMATC